MAISLFERTDRSCAALLVLLTVPCLTSAQFSDAGATMERVAPAVYAIVHADAMHDFPSGTTDWPHSNVGVIVGSRCVLVVDSDFFPSRADADIALIRKVTDRPVCYLVNTHWHGDHTHGNGVYRAQFPKMEIIGTRESGDFIAVNQSRYPKRVIADGSSTRTTLDRYRSMQSSGRDSAGRELSDTIRSLLATVIKETETQLREFETVKVASPTRFFAGATTIDVGGLSVELRSRGRANSPDDVTIGVPARGVLFTGDIVVYPVPYAFGVHPTHWVKVLADIEREHPSIVVPGHGPVMHDLRYVTQVRVLFDTVLARVRALAVQGRSAAEVAREIKLDDMKALWLKGGDANAAAYWEGSIAGPLIENTFQCVIGSRC